MQPKALPYWFPGHTPTPWFLAVVKEVRTRKGEGVGGREYEGRKGGRNVGVEKDRQTEE